MKYAISSFFLFTTLSACGTTGELGAAKFNIEGDLHQAEVAVGSQFSASAKVSTFGEKLSVRSDDTGLITDSGDTFHIIEPGEFRIEAWNSENNLVDFIYFYSVQPEDIIIRSGTTHNFTWSAETENAFAMLEGDSIELAVDLVDEQGSPLLHANLLELESPASWQLRSHLSDTALTLEAGYGGSTEFTLRAGENMASKFFVDVVGEWELKSLQISSSPPLSSPTFETNNEASPWDDGAWFLISAYAETWDGRAVLLSHDHFSVGAESIADEILAGAGGMWVHVPSGSYATVNVSAGLLGSSYVVGLP
jgi:hypothetical protein